MTMMGTLVVSFSLLFGAVVACAFLVLLSDADRRPSVLSHMLWLLSMLVLFDAIATASGYRAGMLAEVNPIWVALLERSPITFVVVKSAVSLSLVYVLWWLRTHSAWLIVTGTTLSLFVYAAVGMYHILSILWV
jgi:hypothetical protein